MDAVKTLVRSVMKRIAELLDTITNGRITPNTVTIIGLLAHVPIVWLITSNQLVLAGVLLIIFGLFDTLDGELARLQKRTSPVGMLLDSVTDRMKEILIYVGIVGLFMYQLSSLDSSTAFYLSDYTNYLMVTVFALGGSMLTSYVNAWGEVVLAKAGKKNAHTNQLFRGGFAPFELRMTLLIIGLLVGVIESAVLVIAVLAWLTVFWRLKRVVKALA